ncbi:MAG: hypothetical protein QJQ54_00855 [Mollicutes bacterium]|nr:MAG: hypothetical protein QJQ54_00855 [Mollicutes bacterium]
MPQQRNLCGFVALDASKIKVNTVEEIINNIDVYLIYDAHILFNHYIAGEEE